MRGGKAGGDNGVGADRDGKGQYPLASAPSMYNLIHNLFSPLNSPQTLYKHDHRERGSSLASVTMTKSWDIMRSRNWLWVRQRGLEWNEEG